MTNPGDAMVPSLRKAVDWSLLPDLALVEPIVSGELGAFAALMGRYNRKLYRAARSITGDDAEAEDVVQEAWTRAYAHLREFRGEARLSTWLVRIAVNEALARMRRRRPVVDVTAIDAQPTSSVMMFPFPALDQESDLSRTQVRVMLESAIDLLPPPFRTVFVLRAIEDLSVDEIAAQLGIPPATVRTRMHRARALLRKELEKGLNTCLADVFPFGGMRCRAMTHRVLTAIGTAWQA